VNDLKGSLEAQYPWPIEQPTPDVEAVGRPAEGLDLALSALAEHDAPVIVEIGAEFGGSTRTWLRSLQSCCVVSVDPWPDDYPTHNWPKITEAVDRGTSIQHLFMSFCWEYRDRLVAMRGKSPDALMELRDLGLEPTLVYIDGDHRYEAVMRDLIVADTLFPEAILCGDDWSFRPKARKYRGMTLPVQFAVNDYCAFRGYGVRAEQQTWLIDRMDPDSVPPLRRLQKPSDFESRVEQRLTALEGSRAGVESRPGALERASEELKRMVGRASRGFGR
jgi:hypothetical protein